MISHLVRGQTVLYTGGIKATPITTGELQAEIMYAECDLLLSMLTFLQVRVWWVGTRVLTHAPTHAPTHVRTFLLPVFRMKVSLASSKVLCE